MLFFFFFVLPRKPLPFQQGKLSTLMHQSLCKIECTSLLRSGQCWLTWRKALALSRYGNFVVNVVIVLQSSGVCKCRIVISYITLYLQIWCNRASLQRDCCYNLNAVFFFSLQSTKAVYDRIIDLRIATPQIIINYAMFLEEHNYFEESFKVSRQSSLCTAHCD